MSDAPRKFVSGMVSLAGLPNSGKSTLLNALIGSKIAIVGNKPQTTRTAIQGVLTTDRAQIVFADTPGIHSSPTLLNRRMMDTVRASLDGRDLIVYLVDASHPRPEQDAEALGMVKKAGAPLALALNKIDRLRGKAALLPLMEEYGKLAPFVEIVPVSARSGDGLDRLRELIVAHLPEGPAMFPADYLTDQPERFLGAELIREQILRVTRQEVPHSVAVVVDQWKHNRKLTRISATIYVERAGQKAIIIGAQGSTLKEIGTLARQEIETMLGGKVFLELFVKVRANWRESPEFLNEIDWRMMAGGDRG